MYIPDGPCAITGRFPVFFRKKSYYCYAAGRSCWLNPAKRSNRWQCPVPADEPGYIHPSPLRKEVDVPNKSLEAFQHVKNLGEDAVRRCVLAANVL